MASMNSRGICYRFYSSFYLLTLVIGIKIFLRKFKKLNVNGKFKKAKKLIFNTFSSNKHHLEIKTRIYLHINNAE